MSLSFTLFVVLKYSKKRKIADFVPKFRGEGGMCARFFRTEMIEGDLESISDEIRTEIINY